MGCGTGVLAILAEMKGASHIEAIDIDEWCYLNSIENVERNSCHNIKVSKGDASILNSKNSISLLQISIEKYSHSGYSYLCNLLKSKWFIIFKWFL